MPNQLHAVLQHFESLNWRGLVSSTLVEIADSPDATVFQRSEACKILMTLANDNIIPQILEDGRLIPQLVVTSCLDCLAGPPPKPLSKISKARDSYEQRLNGVKFTLANVGPFLLQLREEPVFELAPSDSN